MTNKKRKPNNCDKLQAAAREKWPESKVMVSYQPSFSWDPQRGYYMDFLDKDYWVQDIYLGKTDAVALEKIKSYEKDED